MLFPYSGRMHPEVIVMMPNFLLWLSKEYLSKVCHPPGWNDYTFAGCLHFFKLGCSGLGSTRETCKVNKEAMRTPDEM